MQPYYRNVYDYIDRFEQEMIEDDPEGCLYGDDDLYQFNIKDDLFFTPRKVGYSLNCKIVSIEKEKDKFKVTLEGTGENDKSYEVNWLVKKGTLLEVNTYEEGVACFVRPSMLPIVIKVVEVKEQYLKVIPWGIDAFYADKRKVANLNPQFEEQLLDEEIENLKFTAKTITECATEIKKGKQKNEKGDFYADIFLAKELEIPGIYPKIEELETKINSMKTEGYELNRKMREKWRDCWDKKE